MFDGLKDMGKLLKQAKDMKSKMKKVQDGLKKLICTGASDGVEVKVTGEIVCTEITINDDLLNDKKRLVKALTTAFNSAAKQSKDAATSQLSAVTGDLNLPGF